MCSALSQTYLETSAPGQIMCSMWVAGGPWEVLANEAQCKDRPTAGGKEWLLEL